MSSKKKLKYKRKKSPHNRLTRKQIIQKQVLIKEINI